MWLVPWEWSSSGQLCRHSASETSSPLNFLQVSCEVKISSEDYHVFWSLCKLALKSSEVLLVLILYVVAVSHSSEEYGKEPVLI